MLKNSSSGYIEKLQILLNARSFREGEYIIYNDTPIKAPNLNCYTKLMNLALPGFMLQLLPENYPIDILRQYVQDEPRLLCQHGDFAVPSDGTYGKTKCIML